MLELEIIEGEPILIKSRIKGPNLSLKFTRFLFTQRFLLRLNSDRNTMYGAMTFAWFDTDCALEIVAHFFFPIKPTLWKNCPALYNFWPFLTQLTKTLFIFKDILSSILQFFKIQPLTLPPEMKFSFKLENIHSWYRLFVAQHTFFPECSWIGGIDLVRKEESKKINYSIGLPESVVTFEWPGSLHQCNVSNHTWLFRP